MKRLFFAGLWVIGWWLALAGAVAFVDVAFNHRFAGGTETMILFFGFALGPVAGWIHKSKLVNTYYLLLYLGSLFVGLLMPSVV